MQAVSLLRERGYTDVRDFTGGMQAWEEAGLPIQTAPLIQLVVSSPGDVPRPSGPVIVARAAPAVHRAGPSEALLDLIDRMTFGQLFGCWLAMVAAFGFLYLAMDQFLPSLKDQAGGRVGPGMALYFSVMCATSVGFGDVVPLGPARFFALVEAVTAIMLFGCVISKLVSRKQELLTAEIHRIASEDRLGRMQMNLHMVMSELQALATDVGAHERLEGVAMIFASELAAVHDLLFRPQHLPSEQILESILARVASILTELVLRVNTLPEGDRCEGTLAANLRVATATAMEICGDCVPRAHAPRVKAWMDRVQDQGRKLSHSCGEG